MKDAIEARICFVVLDFVDGIYGLPLSLASDSAQIVCGWMCLESLCTADSCRVRVYAGVTTMVENVENVH